MGRNKQGDVPHNAGIPLGHILHQLQLAECFFAIVHLDGRAQVSQAEHDRRQDLADLIVQLARDPAALILLGREKFGRQAFQLCLRVENLLEADLAFPLQGKNPPQRRSGQRQADAEREGEQQDQARAEVRKEIADLHTARFELTLGERMHAIGQIDGETSARQYLVLNESGAPGAALLRVPCECRAYGVEIVAGFFPELIEDRALGRADETFVIPHAGFDAAARFEERCLVGGGVLLAAVEQVIADVGAGDVDIGTDLFQIEIPLDIVRADLLLPHLDLIHEGERADADHDHQQQQSAEAAPEKQAGLMAEGFLVCIQGVRSASSSLSAQKSGARQSAISSDSRAAISPTRTGSWPAMERGIE